MTRDRYGDAAQDKQPSPLQWLALYVTRRIRPDVRGALALLLLAGAVVMLAVGWYLLAVVAVLAALGLLWMNGRVSRRGAR